VAHRPRSMAATAPDLTAAIVATLSHDAAIRGPAEAALNAQRDAPGFAPALLFLIDSTAAPAHVRQAAGVFLKNWTARFYAAADWRAPAHDADRAAIKAAITEVMLRVPVIVRRQLSEVLAIIAEHEYPDTWRELVPALGARLQGLAELGVAALAGGGATGIGCDWLSMQGVLETLHAVFERYPWRERSDPLYTEINFSLEHTQAPVLMTLQLICNTLQNAGVMASMDLAMQVLVVGNAELVCKVFFCLSWQELPPYFEENIGLFMTELQRLLVYRNPAIDGGADADDEPTCVDKLIVSVLGTLDLYQSKHDEDFRPFLENFLRETWQLLMRRGNTAKNDGVVTVGIKFLSTVARSPDYALFSHPETLSQLCQQIVIPNIELRVDDEELFEDNPVEYIRRDMEGSDADTRRRGAVELVKGLCVHFEQLVTDSLSSYVSGMLGAQATWKQKDTALFVVTALGWKTGTIAGGVTETSSLIDVLDFFQKQVLPDLSACAATPTQLATPIYAADVIKYVIAFRNQIPKETYGDVIMLCVKLLGAQERVVQTYAAACIERLLSVKDVVVAHGNGVANGNGAQGVPAKGNGGPTSATVHVPRITKKDISPVLGVLLPAVVTALQSSSRSNEYLMRLMLRVITVAKDEMAPYTEQTLGVALSVMNSVIDNPENPQFNHYLFEVVSALIRFAGNPSSVGTFEATLMHPMHAILGRDVVEFGPYAFQVLSQLMALHPGELPTSYAEIIPPLLDPSMWERRGYIRGMVQYLETYIVKNSAAVVKSNQLRPILGIFNKLVASKATDHLGIQLVCTVLESYNLATLDGELMNRIVNVLLTRLNAAKTPKYVQNLLYCLSLIVLRFGVDVVNSAMNSLQPNLMHMFLSQVWIPELPSIIRSTDRRICALAMADVACATDLCRSDAYRPMWPIMITATVALTEGVQTDTAGDLSDEEDESPLESGEAYSGGHSTLRWASGGRSGTGAGRPVVAADVDPRAHLADRVASFTARHPGVYGPVLAELEEGAQAALQKYFAASGAAIS
jgi:exportin-2 (importin alpha re-exporter)